MNRDWGALEADVYMGLVTHLILRGESVLCSRNEIGQGTALWLG